MIKGWRYYNHAMLSTGAPQDEVNLKPLEDGTIWKQKGYPLFVRYVSDYDCGHPTEWWYCLKDSEYRIDTLNAKKRYRITKGRKCFDVRPIDESKYYDAIIDVQIEAYSQYPEQYRPNLSKEELKNDIIKWSNQRHTLLGAFRISDGKLCGFSLVNEFERYCYFVQQKAIPECERDEINAALVDGVLTFYKDKIAPNYPIVDGQRNLVHETAFQEYLCKYFGFRYAYCRLNIVYRKWMKALVNILYTHKEKLKNKNGKLFHLINGVLQMEEIARSFKEDG